jgi:hypothetical protein
MSQVYAQAQAVSQAAVAASTLPSVHNTNSTATVDPEAGLGGKIPVSASTPNGKIRSVDELAEEGAEVDSDVSDEEDSNETPGRLKAKIFNGIFSNEYISNINGRIAFKNTNIFTVSSIYAQMGMFCHSNSLSYSLFIYFSRCHVIVEH